MPFPTKKMSIHGKNYPIKIQIGSKRNKGRLFKKPLGRYRLYSN